MSNIEFTDLLATKYTEELEEAILDMENMEDRIKAEDIYFIENQKAGMLIRKGQQEWTTIQGFCKHYGIMNQKDFEMMLRVMDRTRIRVVNTFHYHNDKKELNLMTKESWIEEEYIKHGDYSDITWAVLRSISGGNDDALAHIMQWVGWKYLHPEDYMLPALSIYGSQNVGKGVFTHRILPTIFGHRQVFHANGDNIIGQFNDHAIIGRSIVCVDESNLSKKADDRLKQLIGNPRVLAHPKGLTPFEVDNCIAYIFTSNDLFGGMKLDSDPESNRRFSMIKVDKSLPDWCRELGLDWEELLRKDEITKNFTDPVEIGKLLYDCIEIAKALGRPQAYHGDDYHEVIESQHPLNEFFAEAFETFPSHGSIPTKEIYEQYKEWKQETDPGGFTAHHRKVTLEAKKWLLKNKPDVQYTTTRVNGKVQKAFLLVNVTD
jgi:hypothetical protein